MGRLQSITAVMSREMVQVYTNNAHRSHRICKSFYWKSSHCFLYWQLYWVAGSRRSRCYEWRSSAGMLSNTCIQRKLFIDLSRLWDQQPTLLSFSPVNQQCKKNAIQATELTGTSQILKTYIISEPLKTYTIKVTNWPKKTPIEQGMVLKVCFWDQSSAFFVTMSSKMAGLAMQSWAFKLFSSFF